MRLFSNRGLCALGIVFFAALFLSFSSTTKKIKPQETIDSSYYDSYFFGNVSILAKEDSLFDISTIDLKEASLGKLLFYDNIISGTNTMSCESCHKQKFAFTDGKQFSIGVHGDTTQRNSMTLVNLAWNNHFFWDGRLSLLEKLVLDPIQNPKELDQNIDSLITELNQHNYYPTLFEATFDDDSISEKNIASALTSFLKTLVSFESDLDIFLYEKGSHFQTLYNEGSMEQLNFIKEHDEKDIAEMIDLCTECHGGFLYGSKLMENNGVDHKNPELGFMAYTNDSNDLGKFKAPSLRNIALTAPYMHDGRFNTLEEVLDHYDKHLPESKNLSEKLQVDNKSVAFNFSEKQKRHMIETLTWMTDSNFITNPFYSNPFEETNFSWQSYFNHYFDSY